MVTIRDFMKQRGFTDEIENTLPPSMKIILEGFALWETTCSLGVACLKIIIAAIPLLAAVQPAALPWIWLGIIEAMAIVYAEEVNASSTSRKDSNK